MKKIKYPEENFKANYGDVHELKTWPSYFNAVMADIKTFEVRRHDRDFKVGDTLLLREWNPNDQEYTGALTTRMISYTLKGGQFGIEEGYIVLGLQK